MRVLGAILSGLLLTVLSVDVLAQPAPRTLGSFVYDPVRGASVLFGGYFISPTQVQTVFGDTWEWNGSTWAPQSPVDSPAARVHHTGTYDSTNSRKMIYGGWDEALEPFKEVWFWNGTNWSMGTVGSFSGGYPELAYDSNREVAVLYIGDIFGVRTSETWEYDGQNWTQQTTMSTPPARVDARMVFDSARNVCLLFGGTVKNESNEYVKAADTWEYDGTNWIERTPANSPPPRGGYGMAYDSNRSKTVLFGGETNRPLGRYKELINDTWEYDGTNWVQVQTVDSPAERKDGHMTFDSSRNRSVLFAGEIILNNREVYMRDTWEYDGTNWQFVPFGQVLQSPTPSNTPTITPTASDTPTLTPTPTVTDSPTDSPSPTATDTPTDSPSPTVTMTPTDTPPATPDLDLNRDGIVDEVDLWIFMSNWNWRAQ